MRRFSANYIFTNTGNPIRNGVVGVNDNGEIIEIIDHKDGVKEYAHTEFRNGIIVPGFVNAHCHTELSHLKGKVEPNTGLAGFVNQIRNHRLAGERGNEESISNAIEQMAKLGTVAVADICNTSDSFSAKQKSGIKFINLIEVLGLESEKVDSILERAEAISEVSANQLGMPAYITAHSIYSLSVKLWERLAVILKNNPIVSVHFAESRDEANFANERTGGIFDNYVRWGLSFSDAPNASPVEILKRYLPKDSRLLLVHNTFMDEHQLNEIKDYFSNAYFVLCPSSNLYIEQTLPNVPMLSASEVKIALGTDSLASSPTLSIFSQIQLILNHFPKIEFAQVLQWATLYGAEALGLEHSFGTIEKGKAPGLNLISPFNFSEMKPYPNSKVMALL